MASSDLTSLLFFVFIVLFSFLCKVIWQLLITMLLQAILWHVHFQRSLWVVCCVIFVNVWWIETMPEDGSSINSRSLWWWNFSRSCSLMPGQHKSHVPTAGLVGKILSVEMSNLVKSIQILITKSFVRSVSLLALAPACLSLSHSKARPTGTWSNFFQWPDWNAGTSWNFSAIMIGRSSQGRMLHLQVLKHSIKSSSVRCSSFKRWRISEHESWTLNRHSQWAAWASNQQQRSNASTTS